MKKHPFKKKYLWVVVSIVSVVVIGLVFLFAIGRLGSKQAAEGRKQLQTALRRSAVACYAAEGIYPPDLDYLCTHYGVQIDDERYHVFYEIFADNLMPDITVLERKG